MEAASTSEALSQKQIKGPATAVFLQDACIQHRFIRSRDTSNIVEQPERLRAVKLGIAAAVARLEHENSISPSASVSMKNPGTLGASGSSGSMFSATSTVSTNSADDLVAALGNLNIAPSAASPPTEPEELLLSSHPDNEIPLRVLRSSARVDILNNAAVKYVHGDIEGDVYLEKLRDLARDSAEKIKKGESEIPDGWSQGDLYCGISLSAYSPRMIY